jgi:FkbM family methyltransferase
MSAVRAVKSLVAAVANRVAGAFGGELRKKIDVFALQKQLLGPGGAAVIFDVGASDGRVTRLYRALFERAHIVCFEPDAARVQSLAGLHLRDVEIEQQALADSEGTAHFFVNADPDTSSLLPSVPLGSHIDQYTAPSKTVSVSTTTLDAYCERHRIDRIDILKMDIQGGELAALRGAASLLAAKRVRLIYLEVEFMELYKDQPLYHHIADFLARQGYDLYGIFNLWSIERDRLAWADAIFIARTDAQ